MSGARDADALAKRIAALSPAKRAALESLLGRGASARERRPPGIPRRDPGAPPPLSHAQERLWFLDRLEPGRATHNRPAALRAPGRLDAGVVERCLSEVQRRHEVIRARFTAREGERLQEIAPPGPLPLAVVDLRGGPAEGRLERALGLAALESLRPFDLARGPLARATLYHLEEEDHLLLVVFHHIVFDAWSAEVLRRELAALLPAFARGAPSPLPEPPVQYADVAAWQRRRLESGALHADLAYWRGRLSPPPPPLELPADRPRRAVVSSPGGERSTALGESLALSLRELARREGATLFMVLLAGWMALLHRLSGQADIAIGVPVAGRHAVETEGLIGCFVNTIVIRTDLSGDPTFRALAARVRAAALEAYEHQEAPFELLVQALGPERRLDRSPFFDVLFNLRNVPRAAPAPGEAVMTPLPVPPGAASFDLSLEVAERGADIDCAIIFRRDLYDESTIERMLGRLRLLLEGAVADPERKVARLPLLTEDERRAALALGAGPALPCPEVTLGGLVAAAALRSPAAAALRHGAETVSFGGLLDRARRIARALDARGIGRGDRVGVRLPRSIDAVVAILGVIEAGAAWVPLDPRWPDERTAFVAADALVRATIGPGDVRALEGEYAGASPLGAGERGPAEGAEAAGDPAYVIYTSGSTGRPKGVVGQHGGVVNRITWGACALPFAAGDVACLSTSLGFVDSIAEIFAPLAAGVPTEILDEETVRDPGALLAALAAARVTRLTLVPSLLRALLDARPDLGRAAPALRLCISSGEALPADLARRFRAAAPHARLVNLYGSSEVAADATWFEVTDPPASRGGVPIGRPIANMSARIVDPGGALAPGGVAGELWIGGPGVAQGYHARPDLTAERFVPDPFALAPGARVFRTGDLARYLPDGNIEWLGRIDHQVKIRGLRIEPGEVEAALLRHPSVREAVVTVREDAPGDTRLAAHLVLRTEASRPSVEDLRRHLRASLPDYMVPGAYVLLEALPLNPSGKVDRRALPAPSAERPALEPSDAPADEVEGRLVRVFEECFGVRPVGARQDFFALGGHSLLAVELIARIRRAFGVELPLISIFERPTVRALSGLLRASAPRASATLIPLQPAGARAPLYLVHTVGGEVWTYVRLAKLLGIDRPVIGVQARGVADGESPRARIDEMADAYVDELVRSRPQGPYHLGGYSMGACLAVEMARRLQAMGREVGVVAVIDQRVPGRRRELGLSFADHALANLPAWTLDMIRRGPTHAWRIIRRRLGRMRKNIAGQVILGEDAMDVRHYSDRTRRIIDAHLAAMLGHRTESYPGRICVFQARIQPMLSIHEPGLGWRRVARGGITIVPVPGDHEALVREPHVRALALRLSGVLAAYDDGARRARSERVVEGGARGDR